MKRITMAMTAALLLCLAAGAAFGARKTNENVDGFKTVRFGTSYGEVKNYLERSFPGHAIDARKPGALVLKQFDMNGLPVDVLFAFNGENKFSGFSLFTRMKGREYDDEVMRDHTALKNAFRVKYGDMFVCKDSLNVFEGVQCSWRSKELTIVTGYRGTDWEYCAYGFVESRRLAQTGGQSRGKGEERKAESAPSPF